MMTRADRAPVGCNAAPRPTMTKEPTGENIGSDDENDSFFYLLSRIRRDFRYFRYCAYGFPLHPYMTLPRKSKGGAREGGRGSIGKNAGVWGQKGGWGGEGGGHYTVGGSSFAGPNAPPAPAGKLRSA